MREREREREVERERGREREREGERARSEGSRVIEEIAELANLSILTTVPILL